MRAATWQKLLGSMTAAFLFLSACAPQNAATPDYVAIDEDPLEPFNRAMYEVNYTLDGTFIRPAAQIYRGVVPEKGRELVSNVVDNLYTPVTFFNSVLQLDPKNSFTALWDFVLNTTVGIGGLFDVAGQAGLNTRPTDFGQTLAIYGAEPGAYLVLPLIGPCNVRDAFGRGGDALMNPWNHFEEGYSYGLLTATVIDARSRNMKLIDDIYNSSLDPYTTFRSSYNQHRAAEIERAKKARRASQEKALNP